MPRGLLILVGVIAVIECVLSAADAGLLGDVSLRLQVLRFGAFWPPLLRGAEPLFAAQPATMFVTHALLHGSFLHMAMNMTILLALGRFTADRYGDRVVLPVFLVGAVAGGAAYGLLATARVPMVGASGADFAFLGIWSVWDLRRHRDAGLATTPVWTRVAALVGLNVVMYFALGGMLAWEAHLGGFLAGLVMGWLLENRARARRWPPPR